MQGTCGGEVTLVIGPKLRGAMTYNIDAIDELKRQINDAFGVQNTNYSGGLFYSNVSLATAMEVYQDKRIWMRNDFIVDPTYSAALCGVYNDFAEGKMKQNIFSSFATSNKNSTQA